MDPLDTHTVLTLVAHLCPRRVLEIGTTAGHMTAHLTAFTPSDALVYSVRLTAEEVPPAPPVGFRPRSDAAPRDRAVPHPGACAPVLDHFGTAHKALRITTGAGTFDATRLAPLDLVYAQGESDRASGRANSLAAYTARRPGGYLVWHDGRGPIGWGAGERSRAELPFPERIYRVAGTRVAFLIKGEGLGATAGADSRPGGGRLGRGVRWRPRGVAHINRAVCAELVARGHDVALVRSPKRTLGVTPLAPVPELSALRGRELPGAVQVRHRWPADFSAPVGSGPLALMVPWEYGRLPRAWLEPMLTTVDEVWCYSRSVLRAFVASGVPEARLALVPPGVDPEHFRPGVPPLSLPTDKRVKLLFLGGTIPRRGFDVLLDAYCRAFGRADDVCLVVKDLGASSFYAASPPGNGCAVRTDARAPEVIYWSADLSADELPRLYAACDALVLPYRGEGFGLPVLEAMACGVPVVVTAGGPTDEFVPATACWRVPARLRYFADESVGGQPTVGRPWWLEPDPDVLVSALREVVAGADERARRGGAARRALGWTWAHGFGGGGSGSGAANAHTGAVPRAPRRRASAAPTGRPRRRGAVRAPAPFVRAVALRLRRTDRRHRHTEPRAARSRRGPSSRR